MGNLGPFIYYFCQILAILIIIRALLSWFPVPLSNPLIGMLYRVTEPFLAPFRRYLNAGTFDFSAWAVIIILEIMGQLALNMR